MILLRAIMSKLRGQRGGVAILTALGFLVFSIPLITGSLGLSQATSIDARVKNEVLIDHYCGVEVEEFVSYLIDPVERWENWLEADDDFEAPPVDTVEVTAEDLCEGLVFDVTRDITVLLNEEGDQFGTIPDDAAYAQRDFQVLVEVEPSDPDPDDVVEYTIRAINRSDSQHRLATIVQVLANGVSYADCLETSTLTLPSETLELIPDNCENRELTWDVPGNPWIQPQEFATVVFEAIAPPPEGETYCTEAWITPGQQQTNSGFTAPFLVVEGEAGDGEAGQCSGEAALVTQLTDKVYECCGEVGEFSRIDYTITVENIGSLPLSIDSIIDLLPIDYEYWETLCTGQPTCVADAPDVHPAERDRLTWKFNPTLDLPADSAITVEFTSQSKLGTTPSGVLYVDAVVSFAGSLEVYSWPTASVTIQTIYKVAVTDLDGNVVMYLEVLVETEDGVITNWYFL